MSNFIPSRHLCTLLLWTLITALGWSAGVLDLASSARTYVEVARLLPLYLAEGLLIGAVAGFGQMLLLRGTLPRPWTWFWATVAGYALAPPVGVVVTVLIPSTAFPFQGLNLLPLSTPSTMTIFLHPTSLFWGGFVLGLFQWQRLKRALPAPNNRKALLWVLACWLGFGLGILVTGWARISQVAAMNRALMGAVIGLCTGLTLLLLIRKPSPSSSLEPTPGAT